MTKIQQNTTNHSDRHQQWTAGTKQQQKVTKYNGQPKHNQKRPEDNPANDNVREPTKEQENTTNNTQITDCQNISQTAEKYETAQNTVEHTA